MMASAVLFELGRKGRDLREDHDTEQKQDEGSPPPEARLSCH
jgi:hypothetical protein